LFIQLPDQRIPLAVVLLALAFIGVKFAPASAMVQFVGLVVLGIGMAALAIDLGRSAPGTRRWWFGTVGLVVAGLPLGMAASLWVARHDIKAQVKAALTRPVERIERGVDRLLVAANSWSATADSKTFAKAIVTFREDLDHELATLSTAHGTPSPAFVAGVVGDLAASLTCPICSDPRNVFPATIPHGRAEQDYLCVGCYHNLTIRRDGTVLASQQAVKHVAAGIAIVDMVIDRSGHPRPILRCTTCGTPCRASIRGAGKFVAICDECHLALAILVWQFDVWRKKHARRKGWI